MKKNQDKERDNTMKVKIENLIDNPFNFNAFSDERLEQLKTQYLSDTKFLEPIKARKIAPSGGKYEITDGHHKVKILKELGIKEIDIEEEQLTDFESLKMLIKRRTRGDVVNAIKQAEIIKKLNDYGMTEESIGKELGLSKSRISTIIRRLDLNEDTKSFASETLCSNGEPLSQSVVDELTRFDRSEQPEVIKFIQKKNKAGEEVTRQDIRTLHDEMTNPAKGTNTGASNGSFAENAYAVGHSSIVTFEASDVYIKQFAFDQQEIECPCCHKWFVVNNNNRRIVGNHHQ